MSRTVVWFSCGAASAVTAKLALYVVPDAVVAYCETGAEHPDNVRFMADVERWLDRPVQRLKSDVYTDTWDVWEKRKYLAGIEGAPCTTALKVGPRLRWQNPDDVHVFGYTYDAADRKRADLLRENYPELSIVTPLIAAQLDKAACLSLIEAADIDLPVMYKLGFNNNNCIPCVKATSPAYWALVRREFPQHFDRMSELSRRLGVRLTRIKGERRFIDEIPDDHDVVNPIAPACDFLCGQVTQEFVDWDG